MRGAPVVVAALAAAALGAAAALAIARGAGWVGSGHSQTVFLTTTPAPAGAATASSTSRGAARPLPGNGFDPGLLYRRRSSGVVTVFAYFGDPNSDLGQASQGSGFVVSPEGVILTNSHVITTAGEGGPTHAASRVYIEFVDHDRVAARVVGWDVFDDVGVLRVDPKAHTLEPVPLGDSAHVQVGDPVAAIGSPFGNENSLTVGVVSATGRSISSLTSAYRLSDAIQTDAPINHGNSGGPLFDARGLVIGINAQIRTDSSGTADGVGFAVPIGSARRSMEQLLATGHVAYAYVGLTTDDVTPSVARRLGLSVRRGALVDDVCPGSPSAAAGLRGGSRTVQIDGVPVKTGGDVITAIDGKPVTRADDIARIVTATLSPGQTVRFRVQRGGNEILLPVTLSERPAAPTRC
ncbi:MAG TPA: trypsin-like peptidase domain-containing protein [Gaiellaceae bacterium]|jgi:S1-C subfamily serine protease